MWKCHKCGKPVFFAERKVSIGKDWHPECLRCAECGKRLNSGAHAEHKSIPYCHVPCYAALFGPQLFGHGTRVESHKSYGIPNANIQKQLALPKEHLEAKLKNFNDYYDKKSQKIKSREVNGRLVFEGPLRVYWGIEGIIHLKEDCDQRTVVLVRKRNSWRTMKDLSSDKVPLINTSSMTTSNSSVTMTDENDTTVSESISYDTLSFASDIQSMSSIENSPSHIFKPAIKSDSNEEDKKLHQSKNSNLSVASEENSVYKTLSDSFLSSCNEDVSDISEENVESPLSLSEDYATPQSTLKSVDYENFQNHIEKEYIHQANLMSKNNNGTLKTNQPIDASRINDSLKLYGDSVMTKSISESTPIQVLALPKANLISGILDAGKINDTFDRLKTSLDGDHDMRELKMQRELDLSLLRHELQKYEQNINIDTDTSTTPDEDYGCTKFSNGFDSNDDSDTDTLKANNMNFKDCKITEYNNNTENQNIENSFVEHTKGYINEDGVVLRKPPKIGSTAIKRRSGNRRSRMKLKRRCSINGHFYNRETSFFTPPRGSQMNVWITSLTNTKEIVNLLLEKYKVESQAENFALFVIKDNGEQRRIKDDEFPLITRIMLGPYEDVAKIFLMDSKDTLEISNEVAQFLNLSIAELQAIINKFNDEEEREMEKIRSKYAIIRQQIESRMESLKVRL
ncbi:uncharacterized protein LOC134834238 isoform X2 [Culicoides brevitarsis]|uniref:uncharacterized protein LOC134834238 isoform X2 n=1 Tax=Culicoides brevitarsis TaxID=469753 RepID=UPI00307B600E